MPMKLEQARKMRDGLLKGNSVMAQAWKELITGAPAASPADEGGLRAAPSTGERGAHTIASMKAKEEGW